MSTWITYISGPPSIAYYLRPYTMLAKSGQTTSEKALKLGHLTKTGSTSYLSGLMTRRSQVYDPRSHTSMHGQ
jgi:hypothetical protein